AAEVFGVELPFGCRYDEESVRCEPTRNERQERVAIGDMLDHLDADHEITRGTGQIVELEDRPLAKLEVAESVVPSRVSDRIGVDLDREHVGRTLREQRRPVTLAATEVENTLASGKPRREKVAVQVLVGCAEIRHFGHATFSRP